MAFAQCEELIINGSPSNLLCMPCLHGSFTDWTWHIWWFITSDSFVKLSHSARQHRSPRYDYCIFRSITCLACDVKNDHWQFDDLLDSSSHLGSGQRWNCVSFLCGIDLTFECRFIKYSWKSHRLSLSVCFLSLYCLHLLFRLSPPPIYCQNSALFYSYQTWMSIY